MNEISASYNATNMRLCQMPVRQFNGYVRIADSEKIEHEDGSTETREFHRRVLSKDTIKAGNALRSEISRALGQIGLKVPPLGILVDSRGLESLKVLERSAREKAEAVREMMIEDLLKANESETLAISEVDLIALRLLPEEEFAEGIEKLLAEALDENFDRENSRLAANFEDIIRAIECGHSLVAQRRLSAIGRFLTELAEQDEAFSQMNLDQIELLKIDLTKAKQIIAGAESPVGEKIENLKRLRLFDGITVCASVENLSSAAAV